jgi:hypothetical protein
MDQPQLGEELGSGAYGTVKRVIHRPTNVAMAMKVGPFLNLYVYCPVDLQTPFAGNSFRTR